MSELSRRHFLTRASLTAVAGIAAASGVGLPALLSAGAAVAPEAEAAAPEVLPDLTPLGEDLVAVIRNASSGEVAVMSGTQETVIRDPQLVARLLDAARHLSGAN